MLEIKAQANKLDQGKHNTVITWWGLALLAFRIAVLLLLFSTAQYKIQSDDTPLPLWVLVISGSGFLEAASGTSQTLAEHLDSMIL